MNRSLSPSGSYFHRAAAEAGITCGDKGLHSYSRSLRINALDIHQDHPDHPDPAIVNGPLSGNVYRILDDTNLGTGTYGCVKLAEVVHSHNERLLSAGDVVAVKIIDKHMAKALDLEEFVIRERDIQLQLVYGPHTLDKDLYQGRLHVARMFDYVDSGAEIMFFMEYCKQGSLQKVHFEDGIRDPVDEAIVQRYAKELCHGSMEVLHHRNHIVHRDIQLDNICLDEAGHIVLIDFGLADTYKPSESVWESAKSHKPLLAGNGAYKAPELLFYDHFMEYIMEEDDKDEDIIGEMDGPDIDIAHSMRNMTTGELYQRQDIWSIGVCLFQLATGFLPFSNQQGFRKPMLQQGIGVLSQADMNRMLVELFELPDWFDEEPLSEECKDCIRRMLAVDPKERPTLAEIQQHPWLNGTSKAGH